MKPLPTRSEIAHKIRLLIDGDHHRSSIEAWATSIATDDDYQFTDRRAWEAITRLCSADAPTTDRKYLYGLSDFEKWLNDLDEYNASQSFELNPTPDGRQPQHIHDSDEQS